MDALVGGELKVEWPTLVKDMSRVGEGEKRLYLCSSVSGRYSFPEGGFAMVVLRIPALGPENAVHNDAGDEEGSGGVGHGGERSRACCVVEVILAFGIMSSLSLRQPCRKTATITALHLSAMKIAVVTSGGDSAGMNAVVRAVVKIGILRQVVAHLAAPF